MMYCRIYNDGSHYIAKPIIESRQKTDDRAKKQLAINGMIDSLFSLALKNNIKTRSPEMFDFIKDNIESIVEVDNIDEFITSQINRCRKNLFLRKRRFDRKAFLHKWNYFITISYDSKIHTEQSFKKSLKKCLSNLSTRRGWRFMGVWERGERSNRLHFHALLYIPNGQSIGEFALKKDYDTKNHCMQSRNENSFFANRFGVNDFKIIPPQLLNTSKKVYDYVTKYIGKSDESIMYSRHIPEYLEKYIKKDDILLESFYFVTEYILYDDVFEKVDDDIDFEINYSYLDSLAS